MDRGVPPYRPPRSRKPVSVAALLFLLLFFAGVVLLLFLKSPLSEIQEIEVIGNQIVSDQEILKTAQVAKGGSYYGWNQERANERLERMREIRSVTSERIFPGRIRLTIDEENRIAFWSDEEKIVPVLSKGEVLFDRPWDGAVDRPLLRGWSKNELTDSFVRQLAKVPKKIVSDISEIRLDPDHTYPTGMKVYTRQGHVIRLRMEDFARRITVYPIFRNRSPGTLNLLGSTKFTPGTGNKTD
ncbi:cell division protein FtsQ/DivIB [Marininema halotolerans]|uniref:Cell division septal protein FtsQ n=1 Tax=Marininema halotolerans TaxID=1155944 RepID=A0A1I6QCR6_9BACL|nr:FtsQ-type POTRA domain-containing protein [Marininema halotolerans]SFS50098.1 Cell division septal protein FtsQ [Marininema halotolerans]